MFSKFRSMARATWTDKFPCTKLMEIVVDHLYDARNFFFAQTPFRFYCGYVLCVICYVGCWIILTALNSKIPDPRRTYKAQVTFGVTKETRLPEWKMSTWTMNPNFSTIKPIILHLIWIPLSVPVCFRLFVGGLRQTRCEKWRMRNERRYFWDSFYRQKHVKTRKV